MLIYLKGILAALPSVVEQSAGIHAVMPSRGSPAPSLKRRAARPLSPKRAKDRSAYRGSGLITPTWGAPGAGKRSSCSPTSSEGSSSVDSAPAILGKELLREVYAAPGLQQAHWCLVRFYGYAAEAEVPPLTRLATTISRWEQEVLSFHVTGISTGPVEAQNLVTEKIRRIGHGFRNFENYRLRLLLHSGVQWETRPTARIRARHPRLVA